MTASLDHAEAIGDVASPRARDLAPAQSHVDGAGTTTLAPSTRMRES